MSPNIKVEEVVDMDEKTFLLPHDQNSNESDSSVFSQASRKGSGYIGSTLLLVNITLGAGMFNLPYALVKSGGIVSSFVVQAVILSLFGGSMLVIAKVGITTGTNTYACGIGALCGRRVRLCCAALLIIFVYGASIVNIIIVGDQFDKAFFYMFGQSFCTTWYMHRAFTVSVAVAVFVLPFSFFKRMDSLTFVSGIGALAMMYLVIMVIWKFIEVGMTPGARYPVKPESWTDSFWLIPALCFSYMCHPEIIPVVSCLSKQTMGQATKVVCSSLFLCAVVNSGVAVLGFLSFGDTVFDDLLLTYKTDKGVMAAHVLIAVKSIVTAPVFIYVVRTSLDSFIHELFSTEKSSVLWIERTVRFSQSLVLVVSSTVLALVIPNFKYAIQMIGILGMPLVFIFPALCLLQMSKSEMGRRVFWYRVCAVVLIFVGVAVIGIAIGHAIRDVLHPGSEQDRDHILC